MPYRHTQRGTLTLIVCLPFAAIDALIAWRAVGNGRRWSC